MPKSLQAHVAQEIRAEMGRKRATGAELARRLGVSEAYISRRLADDGSITLQDLERLADALGVRPARFFPSASPEGVAA